MVVIGDRRRWGNGYGRAAVRKGVRHALFQWRKDKVVAKIHLDNRRSKRVFRNVGFTKNRELKNEEEFALTLRDLRRRPPETPRGDSSAPGVPRRPQRR